jgi:ABC-type transporter Mla MlaB component
MCLELEEAKGARQRADTESELEQSRQPACCVYPLIMKTKRKRRSAAPASAESPGQAFQAESSGAHVVLESHCCVKNAAGLKQSLNELAGEAALVTLDVRAVERIDTAAIQLMCAFARERTGKGHPIAWMGDVTIVREAATVLGVQSMLSLPPADAAMMASAAGESMGEPAMRASI